MKNLIYKAQSKTEYEQIAMLWRPIIGDIDAAKVALCLHQYHLSGLLNNPSDSDKTVAMAESLFAYEALQLYSTKT